MKKKSFAMIIAALLSLTFFLCACEPAFVSSKMKTKNEYVLSFSALNRTEKEELYLEKGESLKVRIELTEGEVSLLISSTEGEEYYKGTLSLHDALPIWAASFGMRSSPLLPDGTDGAEYG